MMTHDNKTSTITRYDLIQIRCLYWSFAITDYDIKDRIFAYTVETTYLSICVYVTVCEAAAIYIMFSSYRQQTTIWIKHSEMLALASTVAQPTRVK